MNRIENIAETSKLLQKSLNEILESKGYALTKSEYQKEAFCSRFFVWKNEANKRCFRLIWDGRDSWFILEESPYLKDTEKVAWADVTTVPFDSNIINSDYRTEAISSIAKEIK
jgi:hypothetical protein